MKYVPIPIAMLPVGKPLPVNVWNPEGVLLLRKGQPIVSEQHRDKLYAHNASTTESEAQAWQRSYERMVHTLLMEGVEVETIARMPMPSAIRERDYHTGEQLNGGWMDLQEVLRGILYQGGLALNPLPRLAALENKARVLLKETRTTASSASSRRSPTARWATAPRTPCCAPASANSRPRNWGSMISSASPS